MPRTLYTLAYPQVSPADRQMIDRVRATYDLPFKDVVAAYFTLVFACEAVAEAGYALSPLCRSIAQLNCRPDPTWFALPTVLPERASAGAQGA